MVVAQLPATTRGRGGVEAEQLPAMTERGRLTSISMEIRIFANNELLLAIKPY